MPEFQRAVLDSLRQPLETGTVSVARANAHVTFPARVQLIAAMNPCRCGHLGDPSLACARAPRCAADYQAKVSGPLLDRIDLHVEVAALSAADLVLPPPAEGSAEVAARVAAARAVQTARYRDAGVRTNAEADGALLDATASHWDALHGRYETFRINHSEAYSLDGACTNQAESFFSRLRRAEVGTHHHIAGPYLNAYAGEMVWREDNRRVANGEQAAMVTRAAMVSPVSRKWAGYWQRAA